MCWVRKMIDNSNSSTVDATKKMPSLPVDEPGVGEFGRPPAPIFSDCSPVIHLDAAEIGHIALDFQRTTSADLQNEDDITSSSGSSDNDDLRSVTSSCLSFRSAQEQLQFVGGGSCGSEAADGGVVQEHIYSGSGDVDHEQQEHHDYTRSRRRGGAVGGTTSLYRGRSFLSAEGDAERFEQCGFKPGVDDASLFDILAGVQSPLFKNIERNSHPVGGGVKTVFTYKTSFTDFCTELGKQFGLGGGNALAAIAGSVQFSSENTEGSFQQRGFCCHRTLIPKREVTLSNPLTARQFLTKQARKHLDHSPIVDSQKIFDTYGLFYIKRVTYGGLLVMTTNTNDSTQWRQSSLQAALEAGFSGLFASGASASVLGASHTGTLKTQRDEELSVAVDAWGGDVASAYCLPF